MADRNTEPKAQRRTGTKAKPIEDGEPASWWIRVPLPRDEVTGKRRAKAIYGSSEAEALANYKAWDKLGRERFDLDLKARRQAQKLGQASTRQRAPAGEKAWEWLRDWAERGRPKERQRRERSPRRSRDVQDIIGRHVVRAWVQQGKEPWATLTMDQVTPAHIEELLQPLVDQGKLTTADSLFRILRVAFGDWASSHGGTNPMANLHSPGTTKRPARTLHRDQWRALMAECLAPRGPRLRRAIGVLQESGLRPAELFALTWGAINWDDREILVQQAVHSGTTPKKQKGERQTRQAVGPLKTDNHGRGIGERRVPMTDNVLALLRAEWDEVKRDRGTMETREIENPDTHEAVSIEEFFPGDDPANREYIWPNKFGQPIESTRLAATLDDLQILAGIPEYVCASCAYQSKGVDLPEVVEARANHERLDFAACVRCPSGKMVALRLVDFRHSCTTMLKTFINDIDLAAWMGWEVRARLGFGAPKMVAVYGHSSRELLRKAAAELSKVAPADELSKELRLRRTEQWEEIDPRDDPPDDEVEIQAGRPPVWKRYIYWIKVGKAEEEAYHRKRQLEGIERERRAREASSEG